ncbi:MAG: PAS domain S-box protein, partial [Planctomycetes bacterium]|nr:PAS domain S-box protein [Planctomycetota bacterium]
MGHHCVDHAAAVPVGRRVSRGRVVDENTDARCDAAGATALGENYFRLLYESAGIAMVATDRDLNIRNWNAAATRMFGASAAIMLGAPLVSIIPGTNREEGERLVRSVFEGAEPADFEFRHRDAHGDPQTLALTVSPIVDDDGLHIGVLACFRDITSYVDLEAEMARREKMGSLGQLAGALAHHFNNILGGAVTSADFALSSDDPEQQRSALLRTSEALGRATKLIDSLAAFAEGDQRHQDLCDLTEVILYVAGYIEPELNAANVKLELQLEAISVMQVPRAQLVTVLENIIHNAVDAMPDGGTATIRTKCDEGVVTLSVSDTGCGADEATLEHIFEPFYSTKTTGMDLEHHPGLGLAVAHGILEVLGHEIKLTSKVGEGTTVTIR